MAMRHLLSKNGKLPAVLSLETNNKDAELTIFDDIEDLTVIALIRFSERNSIEASF
jgi:hypothetical protein